MKTPDEEILRKNVNLVRDLVLCHSSSRFDWAESTLNQGGAKEDTIQFQIQASLPGG